MSDQIPPEPFESKVIPRLIEEEMRKSFIDYSMSVIVQRALPDVRDGLKPVHRRILYSMHEAGLSPNRPFKKAATVVGDVLGKYHPHGDSAVYDALVRMVQPFSLRYPLISGQGNFGSIDGDAAAAYRYTEAKLAPIAGELLADIDKETVDFSPNFDDRLMEPTVLPAKLPNLLVNGSSGIAVGMATNIPPHNLREVVDACVHLIDNPEATVEDLRVFVRGPDFPTAGLVYGKEGIAEAYETGRGRVIMRARADIEEKDDGRERIVISEIPFQVNKSRLIETIAELVRDKKIDGISDMRDESDRDGMRIVIELKRDAIPYVVLNQLYKHTQMQSTFGVIMLALVNGVPRVLTLKEMLQYFIDHRHVVVVKRTEFELGKAKEREHILEGLKIAVDNIDEVIAIIRGSDTTEEAGTRLRERFELSERQSDAILNMRLAKLTGLEIEQLEAELSEVRSVIADLEDILANRERRFQIIKDELMEVADKYGDERRTEILGETHGFSIEDLIADEEMVITVSHSGYIKRMPVATYRKQGRGGRGITGMDTKEEDWVEHLFIASTHDYLMIFTRDGQCYWLKVHQIPMGSRNSRGKPIVNLINLDATERLASVVPIRHFASDRYLMFVTRKGTVKKTVLSAFGNPRVVGINAMNVLEDDELIDVQITDGRSDIVLATHNGIAIRFHETDVREMGRATTGVRGISLVQSDVVIGMVVVPRPAGEDPLPDEEIALANGEGEPDVDISIALDEDLEAIEPLEAPESLEGVEEGDEVDSLVPAELSGRTLLVVTEKGMGKRTQISAYRLQRRAGKGVINVKTTDKTGKVVAIKPVVPGDELMVITKNGIVNRQSVDGIRVIGRNTQGVRLINLDSGDIVMDVACLLDEEDIEEAVEEAIAADPDVREGFELAGEDEVTGEGEVQETTES